LTSVHHRRQRWLDLVADRSKLVIGLKLLEAHVAKK
jgi:hypothetical protein